MHLNMYPLAVNWSACGIPQKMPQPISAFERGILEQYVRFDIGAVELRAHAQRLFAAAGALGIDISYLS